MICPNCNYKHGYHWDENDGYVNINGDSGEFYRMSVAIERGSEWDGNYQKKDVYACPSCRTVFFED